MARTVAAFAALLASALLVYHEVVDHAFVWDTIPFVVENPWLVSPTLDDVIAMFTRSHYYNWQPLVWLSHALDYALFGSSPGWHHLANVAWHAVDGCLVYTLARRIASGGEFSIRQTEAVAFLTAFIFVVHPQHVQSVAWLVERKDTLYVFFTLLCLIIYVDNAKAAKAVPPGRLRRSLPALLFALALMSKPMAVTVPVVLVLVDVYLGRWDGTSRGVVRLVVEKWYYWLLSACVVAVTLHTQNPGMVNLEDLPLWTRPLTAINNALFYLEHYLVPLGLSPYYPHAGSLDAIAHPGYWLPGALFFGAVTAAGIWCWRTGIRWPLLVEAFYLVTLAPVSGLIQVGPEKALDYYSYLATLPVGFVISAGIVRLSVTGATRRMVVAALAGFYLVALTALAYGQVKIWRNEVTLWYAAWRHYPDAGLVNRNLSGAYLAAGDIDRALFHARESAKSSEAGRRWLSTVEAALAGSTADDE